MIRIDAIWLATEPMDMRAGTETALARVIAVFGAAKPHCAYLFANRRASRMKVLVHDGVGADATSLQRSRLRTGQQAGTYSVGNRRTPYPIRSRARRAERLTLRLMLYHDSPFRFCDS
jgi:hypothetical protein